MTDQATRAEINIDHLKSNLAVFRARIGDSRKLCLAVKGNAYGHGIREISRSAASHVDAFAVASVAEGRILRESGIRLPILLLSPHLRREIPALCRYDLEPFVSHGEFLADYEREMSEQIAKQSAGQGKKLRLHLNIDTGMGRSGAMLDDVVALSQGIANYKHLELHGVCTHFASADCNKADTQAQLRRFEEILSSLKQEKIPCVHAANSAAALRHPESHFDMVRIGIGAYGYGGTPSDGLLPVMSLKSKVVLLKKVPAGYKVSYGSTWCAQRETLLALLPLGYADGYSRLLSNRGQVWLNGQFFPVVGRVCMDLIVIDITDCKSEVRLESDVLLFGSEWSAERVAEQVDTISYEILSSISHRVPRVYVEAGGVV